MFLVDDVPYLIDKAEESTVYRFPNLDPAAAVTLEKVGVLAGQVANLSGAVQLAGPGAGAANVEGVAFGYDSLDLNLLAENRDVYFVPASAYER